MADSAKNAKKAELDKANQGAMYAEQLLGQFKNLSRALQLITDAIAVRPKQVKWYTLRAQIYRALGRNQLAFYDYNSALRLDARSYFNYIGRGLCLRKLRRYGDALLDLETALEAEPGSPIFRFFRGTVYHHMEDYASAIEDYSAAIGVQGFTQRARLLRAQCFEKLGRVSEALADLNAATRGETSNPAGFTALGIILMELGRHSEAVEAFTGAVERAGQSSGAYSRALDNRSWALFMTGRFKEASDDLQSAQVSLGDEKTTDPAPHFHRGAVLLAQKAPLKALPELLRAAELVEAQVRKEARKSGDDGEGEEVQPAGPSRTSGDNASEASTPHGSRAGGASTTRRTRRPVAEGGIAGSHLLSPELAQVLEEPMPPELRPSGSSSQAGGAAASLVNLPGDDDTDSDTFSDAVRERDTSMQEPVRRRGGQQQDPAATGPGSPTKGGADSRPPTSAAAERDRGDGASEAGSVPSGSIATGMARGGFRKAPAARNAGRSASRGKTAASAAREKPWAMVPTWAKERPWPEQPSVYSPPRNRGTAMVAARVHTYVGLAYEMLGHAERALYHYDLALAAWPGCIPARYHAGLCLFVLGKAGRAEATLTTVLEDTATVAAEVQVLPPGSTVEKSARGGATGRTGSSSGRKLGFDFGGNNDKEKPGLWAVEASKSAIVKLGIASVELIPPAAAGEPDVTEAPAPAPAPADGKAPAAGAAAPAPAAAAAQAAVAAAGRADDAMSVGGASAGGLSVRSSAVSGTLAKAAREHEALHEAAARRSKAVVLLARAIVRQAQGKHAEAAADFDGALSVEGALGNPGDSLLCRARSQLALRRVKAALADCEAALALEYTSPSLYDVQGQALAYMGRYSEAVTAFGNAYKALQAQELMEKPTGPQPVSPRAIAAAGPPASAADYLSRRAEAYRAQSNANSAVLDLGNALLARGNDPSLLEQRGHAHTDNQDSEAALADYQLARSQPGLSAGTKARLSYCIGLVHANTDNWEAAVAAFGQGLTELQPVVGAAKYSTALANGASGEDADDEKDGMGGAGVGGATMSKKLAAALATAAMRVGAQSRTSRPGEDEEAAAQAAAEASPAIQPRFIAASGLPMNSATVGLALRNLASMGKGADSSAVKGAMKHWSFKAKVGVTPGVTTEQLAKAKVAARQSGAADGKEADRAGPDRAAGAARQRYLQRLAQANGKGPEYLVRLRIALQHERAKSYQHLGKHYEATMDFTEVLASCPGNPHALLRRGVSYAAQGQWAAASDDLETARVLRPGDARFELNYAALRGVEAVVLAGPGEEPQWPILGLEDIHQPQGRSGSPGPGEGKSSVDEDGLARESGLPDTSLRARPKSPLAVVAPNARGVMHPLATPPMVM